MLLKIFSKRLTLYIFLVGFIVHFFIFLLKEYPLGNVLLVGFVGALAFCGVWFAILFGLIHLLGEKDMAYYFQVPYLDPAESNSYNDNDDDGLSIEELYDFSDDRENNQSKNLDQSDLNTDVLNEFADDTETSYRVYRDENGVYDGDTTEDKLLTDKVDDTLKIDSTGQFNLTANGKTLKISPKDGAQAIRKILYQDEK